ncbi:MAG: cellulase family glycosylhydrolase [Chloroflexota bacterium]
MKHWFFKTFLVFSMLIIIGSFGLIQARTTATSTHPHNPQTEQTAAGQMDKQRTLSNEPATADTDWTLVWSDEFDDTTVDTSKWNVLDTPGMINDELHYIAPDDVSIADGNLVISSQKRDYDDREYTSGKVTTGNDKFTFTYGRVEIRSKQPAGKGLHAAHWLLQHECDGFSPCPTWPPEFDIMEVLGDQTTTVNQNVHYGLCERCRWPNNLDFPQATTVSDTSENYHTYAIEWEPDQVRWYIDDVQTHTWDGPNIPDEPMQIILDTAVGGNWPGAPDDTTVFPAYHYIDYVRVWQRDNDPPAPTPTPSPTPIEETPPSVYLPLIGQGSTNPSEPPVTIPTATPTTEPAASLDLGKGINFGDALEHQNEGDGGVVLEEADFDLVKQAGFDTIRLPVSWTYHASEQAPYTIDSAIFDRVDWAVEQAVQRDLNIVVNMHFYHDFNNNPDAEEERFLALWKQIAEHYQNSSNRVYFELLNEPNGVFNDAPERWNELFAQTVSIIRESNPTRPIIAGPAGWNVIDWLGDFDLPADPNLITTVHYYEPHSFTHQGADWLGDPPPVGTSWNGDEPTLLWATWYWSENVKDEWQTDDQGNDQLLLTFEQPDARFQLHAPVAVQGYSTIDMRIQGAFNLQVGCPGKLQDLQTAEGWNDYEVDLSECESLRDVIIQQNGTAQTPMLVSELTLRGANKDLDLLATSMERAQYLFDTLAQWANQHNTTVFLGEFGAISKANLISRAHWTEFVRSEAEEHGFAWAYWELRAQNFGAYDSAEGAWIAPLLEALMPAETSPADPQPIGPGGEWTLTFEDEFDTLDTDVWHTMWGLPGAYWDHVQWSDEVMKHDNVWAEDGNLVVRHQVRDGEITSGVVTTRERFTQRHGYFEARMQMCQAQGVLNAFWMQRNPDLWPPEIDVVEVLGKEITRPHTTIHYGYPEHKVAGFNEDTGINYANDFHTFGMEWDADQLIWYIDGEEYWRVLNPGENFDAHEMYMQFNMHSGNGWSGYPDMNDTTPCYMKVDHVRVWQRP